MLFSFFSGDLSLARACGLERGKRGGTWENVVLMLKRGGERARKQLTIINLSEIEVLTEKQEKYRRKNKIFTAWLPIDVHEWFVNYLKVKSIGSSTGERFRQWPYALQKQNSSSRVKSNVVTISKIEPTSKNKGARVPKIPVKCYHHRGPSAISN